MKTPYISYLLTDITWNAGPLMTSPEAHDVSQKCAGTIHMPTILGSIGRQDLYHNQDVVT